MVNVRNSTRQKNNALLRRVRVKIVTVQNKKLYIFFLCLCFFSYPSYSAHVLWHQQITQKLKLFPCAAAHTADCLIKHSDTNEWTQYNIILREKLTHFQLHNKTPTAQLCKQLSNICVWVTIFILPVQFPTCQSKAQKERCRSCCHLLCLQDTDWRTG